MMVGFILDTATTILSLYISMRIFRLYLVLFTCVIASCIGSRKWTNFSIEREPGNTDVSAIYLSIDTNYSLLDSKKKAGLPEHLIDGSRLCVMVFFEDNTLYAPICFNYPRYRIDDFLYPAGTEQIYQPRGGDWGRYKVLGDTIYTEVMKPWYNPAIHYDLHRDTLVIINDSIIKSLPSTHVRQMSGREKVIKTEGFLNSMKGIFHKSDTVDLNFLDPSKAWINQLEGKRVYGR